jgi:hypothetical protein
MEPAQSLRRFQVRLSGLEQISDLLTRGCARAGLAQKALSPAASLETIGVDSEGACVPVRALEVAADMRAKVCGLKLFVR